MKFFESWKDFKKSIGYNGVQIQPINRENSIKASGGEITYDRYDVKLGLHKKPKEEGTK